MISESGPLVTVIIPTYNRADLLPRAVKSVLSQSYRNLECLIVDDASTDNTEEVVRGLDDERVVYIRHERNRGQSAARNTGIAHASGELVALLDSDDEWLPGKLAKQVALMEASPKQVGVVHCMHYARYARKNRQLEIKGPADFTGEVYPKLLRGVCPSIMSSVLVKRECFENCGTLDERLPSFVDYDLWLRVAQRYQFACVPEFLTVVYQHEGSRQSKDITPRKEGLERILSKWGLEIRKHRGEKGYEYVKRHFLVSLYANAMLQSIRARDCKRAGRYLLHVIRLQPAWVIRYAWLALKRAWRFGIFHAPRLAN
jgi:glycosyltransferase involved in cell wall biosynthesis